VGIGAYAARDKTRVKWITGGTFLMGAEHPYPEKYPVGEATVGGFRITCEPEQRWVAISGEEDDRVQSAQDINLLWPFCICRVRRAASSTDP
jgi:hypothetical protein